MATYKVISKQLKSGWWVPMYDCSTDIFEPLGYDDLRFKTKDEADQFILDQLKEFNINEGDGDKIIVN